MTHVLSDHPITQSVLQLLAQKKRKSPLEEVKEYSQDQKKWKKRRSQKKKLSRKGFG